MNVSLILGAMAILSTCAIACIVIVSERKRKSGLEDIEPSHRNECGFCKHFDPCRGNSCIGTCTFFFKSFKPWNPACHRFELRELKGGEA